MNDALILKPINYIKGSIDLPGSKSISNRVLLLSALSKSKTYINNLLDCDDTKYMLNALKLLGVKYILSKKNTACLIYGKGIDLLEQKKYLSIFVGNAGTVMRPLIAVLSLRKNNIVLTGDPRMQERPIQHLVEALRQSGAIIEYTSQELYPPVLIKGGFIGGSIKLSGDISSQFLTAILIAAPLAILDTNIVIIGELVSKPYVDLTINLMKKFGIKIKHNSYQSFFIQGNQEYRTPEGECFIEGDASSASYFLAAAAIKGGSVTVHGVGKNSIQGDIYFAKILEKMGASIIWGDNYITCARNRLNNICINMNNVPDVAMTLAIVVLFAVGQSSIQNIYNWRVKETDRLSAMSTELRKIGAIVEEGKDFLSITPPEKFSSATINTYNDHRIAMCFSLLALANIDITILNPQCTKKTFPKYFETFKKISY
ncbi:3-phosphoshikimate 1-carboxyvinyltransferase [Buchnera aphidicola (Eriosoma grossulariae)]|uniref:3-phosphoshikimate 1-carboxyvinyltransferase n=1 Tax=Buchnera aphidicola TaxID=9 RepID=UPI0034648227